MRTISRSSPDAPAISDGHYAAIAEVDRLGLSKLPPAIFEKDLLITRILGLLKTFNWGQFPIVFCGGTALSKGHKLIQRMSEDVDFKVLVPPGLSRNQCRNKLEDERLVRHLYDVQQLLQRMPNVIKEDNARQLFEQIITTDSNKYPGKDNAFTENPAQRLANALEQLNTYSSDFEALYRNFVSGLVWGPPVGFSEAHRAFSQLACHLLNECQTNA